MTPTFLLSSSYSYYPCDWFSKTTYKTLLRHNKEAMKHETKSNGILKMLKESLNHFLPLQESRKHQLCCADYLQAFCCAEVLRRPKSTGSSGCTTFAFQRLRVHEICSVKDLAIPTDCLAEKKITCGLTHSDVKAFTGSGLRLQSYSGSLFLHQAK